MNRVPTLVVDKNKCERNIDKILDKVKKSGSRLRPHFKTHQSHAVGRIFRKKGIDKITVSSFAMADYFATDDWNDITVAFPINLLEIETINKLAAQIQLNIVAESLQVLVFMEKNLRSMVGVFLKIDVGYHRTGIDAKDLSKIEKYLLQLDKCKKLNFLGFLAHAGHSYKARGPLEIQAIHQDSLSGLVKLKEHFARQFPEAIISYGDTPTASVVEDFSEIDEVRAGNFIYYDLTQELIGSCRSDEISVAVECPIVALHPDRNEIILYGGGVHFSKDRTVHPKYGTIFGLPVAHQKEKWGDVIPGAYVKSLSQEHGMVHMPTTGFDQWEVGMTMKVLPVHSCMAANLLRGHTVIV